MGVNPMCCKSVIKDQHAQDFGESMEPKQEVKVVQSEKMIQSIENKSKEVANMAQAMTHIKQKKLEPKVIKL